MKPIAAAHFSWLTTYMLERNLGQGAVIAVLLVACGGDVRPKAMQHSHVFYQELRPDGIPTAWILAGKPKARVRSLMQSEDGQVRAALWDCTAGKFNWHFGADEMVHILEGEVQVSSEDGETRTLKPGHVAYFLAGTKSVWNVPKYVKKIAILRDNPEPFMRRVARKFKGLFASRD